MMSPPDNFHYSGGELALFARARNWKRYWSRVLSPYIGENVLEVGAGLGHNRQLLHYRGRWTWLEPDRLMAAELSEQAKSLDRVSAMAGTLATVSSTCTFDTIIYIDVLEHISDDRAELQAAAEHLRPGGHLVVLAPAHASLFSDFDAAIGHFRRYTASSLIELAPAELKLEYCRYLDSVGLFASFWARFFSRRSLPSTAQIAFWDKIIVPVSRVLDPLLFFRIGKSVLVVWSKSERSPTHQRS